MRCVAVMSLLLVALAGCASEDAPAGDGLADTDEDGFPDSLELELGTDPRNATDVPDVMVHEPITFSDSGMIVFGTEDVATGMGCGVQGTIDTWVTTWSIAAPGDAVDAHVVDLVFTATLPATMVELDIFVFGPDGDVLTEATPASIPPIKTDTVAVDGKLPVGDYRVEVRGCEGSGEVTLDAEGVLGYAPSVESLLHAKGVEHEH